MKLFNRKNNSQDNSDVKPRLLIVGARGWGREVYAAVCETKAYQDGEFDIYGFLDSDNKVLDGLRGEYPPIISSVEDYKIKPNDMFFVAMGDSKWRRHYAELLKARGARFHTIICTNSYVNPTAQIGEGSFISGWTTISDNATIGSHVMIHGLCTIGHDVRIDDYASIEAYSFVGGQAIIGQECVLHPHTTVLRHIKLGKQAEVGAGSVVMRDVPDGMHVHGNPAKKIIF